MICIEFLATKRTTGLGEAHISPHHPRKNNTLHDLIPMPVVTRARRLLHRRSPFQAQSVGHQDLEITSGFGGTAEVKGRVASTGCDAFDSERKYKRRATGTVTAPLALAPRPSVSLLRSVSLRSFGSPRCSGKRAPD